MKISDVRKLREVKLVSDLQKHSLIGWLVISADVKSEGVYDMIDDQYYEMIGNSEGNAEYIAAYNISSGDRIVESVDTSRQETSIKRLMCARNIEVVNTNMAGNDELESEHLVVPVQTITSGIYEVNPEIVSPMV